MPHALDRLWERHRVVLIPEELHEIEARFRDPKFRKNHNLFRQIGVSQCWQVNLRRYYRDMFWVTVVYDAVKGRILTVLDVPINATLDEARNHISGYYRRTADERRRARARELQNGRTLQEV